MCGISGVLSRQKSQNDAKSCVESMVLAQRHRGPDDEGVYSSVKGDITVTLGHNRLSIIDITSDGHQPMQDNDTGNTIVFNGEIYNYKEIRASLLSKGYVFKSKTDTEVILKAYAEWGIDSVRMMRGIFAFAIWDNSKSSLILARDQMGVKPLYYYNDGYTFYFASEVRALLKGGIPANISNDGLNSLLGYGSVQEPFTLIKGVLSLLPGSFAVVGESLQMKEQTYWSPDFTSLTTKSLIEAEKTTTSLLEEAIKLQMVSDVPLGAFLSGGIDSSAIVALMRKVNEDSELCTFSVIFDDPKYDERDYARLVAQKNRTKHMELLMTGSMIKDSLQQMISSYDQPSVDGMNSWWVSKLVKESGITVALSGVGGDELFVGYGNFTKPRQIYRYASKLNKLPHILGLSIEQLAVNEFVRKIGETVSFNYDPYFIMRRVFSDSQYANIISTEYRTGYNSWIDISYNKLISQGYIDEVCKISWLEQRSYMLSTLLRDTDQMSMAHSLEIRVPLIDHKVVEYVTALPMEIKMNMKTPKILLVEAAGGGIPKECIYRRKQGFAFPFDTFIKNELYGEIESFVSEKSLPLFDKGGLKKLWNKFQNGEAQWSRVLLLYIIDCWLKEYKVSQ